MHRSGIITLLTLLAPLLSACALLAPADASWPEGAPERDYFEARYGADEVNQPLQSRADYLGWIRRFYTGVDPVPGWLEMSERVLRQADAAEQQEVAGRLHRLGRKISTDWARDNSVRTLDTRMGNVWRDALIEAIDQDDARNYLVQLEQDVDDLLARRLQPDEIYFERYYIDEFGF